MNFIYQRLWAIFKWSGNKSMHKKIRWNSIAEAFVKLCLKNVVPGANGSWRQATHPIFFYKKKVYLMSWYLQKLPPYYSWRNDWRWKLSDYWQYIAWSIWGGIGFISVPSSCSILYLFQEMKPSEQSGELKRWTNLQWENLLTS